MPTRRQFIKLLAVIPLALGLRWPVAEPKPEPAWEGYVEKVTVTSGGLAQMTGGNPADRYGCTLFMDETCIIWMQPDVPDMQSYPILCHNIDDFGE